MGVVRRQGIKTSAISYVGVALGAISTLWLMPHFLKPDEIGLLTLLVSVSTIIAPIAQMGVAGIINKYYPRFKDDPKQESAFFFLVLLVPTCGFLVAMLILFLAKGWMINYFSENAAQFVDYMYMLVPISFLFAFRNVFDNLSRVQLRIAMPKLFKDVIYRILIFTMILSYYFLDLSFTQFIYGYTAMLLINVLLIIIYVLKLRPIRLNTSLSVLGKGFGKQALMYGIFIILSGFSNTIITKIDGWMISSMIDLSNNGIYSIGLYIGMAIQIPKHSVNLISLPIVSRELHNNNVKAVGDLYRKSALVQLIVGSILLICVWVNIDTLFSVMPKTDVYMAGKYVVLFIGIGALIDMSTGINNEIIFMSPFYRLLLFIIISLIGFAILINKLLIPMYGITGAAIASAISMGVFNLLKFSLIWYRLKIQPFTVNTLKAAGIAVFTYLCSFLIPDIGIALVDIAVKSTVLITIFSALIYFLKVSEDINSIVDHILIRLGKLRGR